MFTSMCFQPVPFKKYFKALNFVRFVLRFLF